MLIQPTYDCRQRTFSFWNEEPHHTTPQYGIVCSQVDSSVAVNANGVFTTRVYSAKPALWAFNLALCPLKGKAYMGYLQYSDSGWFTCQLFPGSFQNEDRDDGLSLARCLKSDIS